MVDNYPSMACGLAPTACFGVVPSKGLKTEKHKTNTNSKGREWNIYTFMEFCNKLNS